MTSFFRFPWIRSMSLARETSTPLNSITSRKIRPKYSTVLPAARAIVTRPALVLADEPTGALDSKSSRLLLDRLEELNRELGTTILMVTHDAFTASCCRRVVFLRDGQIFLELRREGRDRRAFFQQIIRVVSQMGGEMEDVL